MLHAIYLAFSIMPVLSIVVALLTVGLVAIVACVAWVAVSDTMTTRAMARFDARVAMECALVEYEATANLRGARC